MRETDTPTRLKLAEWVDDYVFYGGRILEWEERSTGVWILLKNVPALAEARIGKSWAESH